MTTTMHICSTIYTAVLVMRIARARAHCCMPLLPVSSPYIAQTVLLCHGMISPSKIINVCYVMPSNYMPQRGQQRINMRGRAVAS